MTNPKSKIQNPKSILVAGIGNIFEGDDAFGVEVARYLLSRQLPAGVKVVDFGIRGLDLAYALADGYEVTILIDAVARGKKPGTLFVIEPDLSDLENENLALIDAHTMNPMNVLRVASSMGARLPKILLVGCEPESFGGEEGIMGLSESVAGSICRAGEIIERLIADIGAEKHYIVSV